MNCPPSDPSGLSNILKVVSTLFPATDHVMLVMFQVPSLSLPAVTSGGEISFMVASSVDHLKTCNEIIWVIFKQIYRICTLVIFNKFNFLIILEKYSSNFSISLETCNLLHAANSPHGFVFHRIHSRGFAP